MSVSKDFLPIAGASGQTGDTTYSIPQSIRFNALDNPYLSKTFASKGSPKKFSLSWWTKLSFRTINATSESQMFFIAYHSSGYQTDFSIQSAARASGVVHTFRTYSVTTSGGACWDLRTSQLFRDPTAWYHFVVVSDTDNDVASNRFRLFINGLRVTDFGSATYPSSGVEPVWNNSTSVTHYIGSRGGNTNTRFDGYMTEINHIDGYDYGPEYYGEFNSNGIWIPKQYSGSYGTNGFYITGSDSSNLGKNEATANTFGAFASSGLAAHDQVTDTPTDNFCTLNPLDERGSGILSNGDLRYAGAATYDNVTGTLGMSSGKWYWEVYIEDEDYAYLGVQDGGVSATGYAEKAVALVVGDTAATIHEDDSNSGNDAFIANNGDIVGVAVDIDNQLIWWSKNGQWYRANQASGATIDQSEVEAGNQGFDFSSRSPTTGFFVPYIGNYTHATTIINFGQEGTFAGNVTAGNNTDGDGNGNFKYSVPSGFKALRTKNLF